MVQLYVQVSRTWREYDSQRKEKKIQVCVWLKAIMQMTKIDNWKWFVSFCNNTFNLKQIALNTWECNMFCPSATLAYYGSKLTRHCSFLKAVNLAMSWKDLEASTFIRLTHLSEASKQFSFNICHRQFMHSLHKIMLKKHVKFTASYNTLPNWNPKLKMMTF